MWHVFVLIFLSLVARLTFVMTCYIFNRIYAFDQYYRCHICFFGQFCIYDRNILTWLHKKCKKLCEVVKFVKNAKLGRKCIEKLLPFDGKILVHSA